MIHPSHAAHTRLALMLLCTLFIDLAVQPVHAAGVVGSGSQH
jgi:hypothetical protein